MVGGWGAGRGRLGRVWARGSMRPVRACKRSSSATTTKQNKNTLRHENENADGMDACMHGRPKMRKYTQKIRKKNTQKKIRKKNTLGRGGARLGPAHGRLGRPGRAGSGDLRGGGRGS